MSNSGPVSPIVQTQFKGMRTDKGLKFIGPEYLFLAQNVNYDDLVGANKILMPDEVFSAAGTNNIDGIFNFKYLDDDNIPISDSIVVYGGTLYKNWLSGTLTPLYTGLEIGRCTFSVLNDKLFIANGLNYPIRYNGNTVAEMGAPLARASTDGGNPNGVYYYAQTFVTAGGDEYIGTVSNTITVASKQIILDIPIGYSGTTSRKIYRTATGSNVLKLLATIADNTTLEYTDNIADGSLGATIIAVNNPCPKVKYIKTSFEKLVGAGDPEFPTQAWVGDPEIEIFDSANFIDVTNVGNDATPIMGLSQDYGLIVVGSQLNNYTIDVSGDSPVITLTRANVGILSGYSMVTLPANGDFPGGVMFLSSEKDFRLLNGNFAQPVATSLDNIQADNFSQVIRPTLDYYVTANSNVFAEFFDYKYHCIIDSIMVVYDIRTLAWSIYHIQTDSYSPMWNTLAVINDTLYAGQLAASVIDEFYSTIKYRGEEVPSLIQSGQMLAGDTVRYMQDFIIFLVIGSHVSLEIELIFDGQNENKLVYQIDLNGGAFSQSYYSSQSFETSQNSEDYRCIHLNRWARWVQYKITQTRGRTFYRGFKLIWQDVKNKE